MVEMILNRNPTKIVNIVFNTVIRGNIVRRHKLMKRKQEGLSRWVIEMDDPSDTFNSMVSKDPISDDDCDGFIRNFSEMTELN